MAIKASVTITISKYRDCDSITRYFKLQASTAAAPAIPTTLTPSGWDTSEPTYTSGSTNTLYYTDCIVFSDGTFQYTDDGNGKAVKSSSYEAAKEAYNKAQAAQDSINDLNIGGRNLLLDSKKNTKNKTEYKVQEYTLSEDWIVNEEYTLSIKGNVTNGKFGAWRDFGSRAITFSMNYDEEKDLWWYTFKCPAPYDSTRPTNILTIYNTPDTVEHNSTIEWIKLEKGNMYTDWSPAPEDIDEELANKPSNQDLADAQNSINSNIIDIRSELNILHNMITSFVVDEDGQSMYTEDGNSFTYTFGDAISRFINNESDIRRLNQIINSLTTVNYDSTNDEYNSEYSLNDINNNMLDGILKLSYVQINGHNTNTPEIILGSTVSDFKVRITNTSIDFMYGTKVLAYANTETFSSDIMRIQKDLRILRSKSTENEDDHGFVWAVRKNNNLSLKIL